MTTHQEELEAQRRVKSTLANLEIEGLRPTELAIQLSYQVALGKITADEAAAKLTEVFKSEL